MSDKQINFGQTPIDAAAASAFSGQALRKRAEEQVRAMELTAHAVQTPEEIQQVLYELRVHQIELEMQNEELRTAHVQIEAGRARYFDLYDLAPVGYCTLSEQGLILEANLTAATLLATARGKLPKQPLSHFIHKDDQDIYYLHRKKLFDTPTTGSGQAGEPQECELRLVKPDGAYFWAHLRGTTAQAEDGAPVCRVVISDITTRKQAEEALARALKEKNMLFRELQHRAKNTFNMIASLVDLEAGQAAQPGAQAALEKLYRRINILANLYTKLYASGEAQTIQLDHFLAEVAQSMVSALSDSGQRVELRLDMDEMTVNGNCASSFGLILNELITNALKYAFSGGRRGLVSVRLKHERGGVVLEVANDGLGLPEGFDLAQSLGFGLTLVRLLAQQLDGEAYCEQAETTRFGVRVNGACLLSA